MRRGGRRSPAPPRRPFAPPCRASPQGTSARVPGLRRFADVQKRQRALLKGISVMPIPASILLFRESRSPPPAWERAPWRRVGPGRSAAGQRPVRGVQGSQLGSSRRRRRHGGRGGCWCGGAGEVATEPSSVSRTEQEVARTARAAPQGHRAVPIATPRISVDQPAVAWLRPAHPSSRKAGESKKLPAEPMAPAKAVVKAKKTAARSERATEQATPKVASLPAKKTAATKVRTALPARRSDKPVPRAPSPLSRHVRPRGGKPLYSPEPAPTLDHSPQKGQSVSAHPPKHAVRRGELPGSPAASANQRAPDSLRVACGYGHPALAHWPRRIRSHGGARRRPAAAKARSQFASIRCLPGHTRTTSRPPATGASGTRLRARVSLAGSTRRLGQRAHCAWAGLSPARRDRRPGRSSVDHGRWPERHRARRPADTARPALPTPSRSGYANLNTATSIVAASSGSPDRAASTADSTPRTDGYGSSPPRAVRVPMGSRPPLAARSIRLARRELCRSHRHPHGSGDRLAAADPKPRRPSRLVRFARQNLGQRMERGQARHVRRGEAPLARVATAGWTPQPYAVYVDERDAVWLTDFGANAIVRFDLRPGDSRR